MRLKTEIWVKAYLRRCAGEGVDAVLVRRGDSDAGAVFVKVSRLDGTAALYGPAPASFDTTREDRLFERSIARDAVPEADVDTYLERQISFDSDVWILAVDDRQGRHFLDDWLAPP